MVARDKAIVQPVLSFKKISNTSLTYLYFFQTRLIIGEYQKKNSLHYLPLAS